MDIMKFLKKIAYWTIPRGVRWCRDYLQSNLLLYPITKSLLQRNQKFYNIHKGERCFILATGPSISKQDLKPLQSEWCFAVSDFYKHIEYRTIKPSYYALAPMHPPFTDQDGIRRLNEINQFGNCNETFFFPLSDKGLVERSGLPAEDNIFFLKFHPRLKFPQVIDLTKTLPGVRSVTSMAVYIAIYMGFSEIYLLGCDHNRLWKWDFGKDNKTEHFFNGPPSIGYEPSNVDSELRTHLKLREQYRWLNEIAKNSYTTIYNASPDSYIDIFQNINFGKVIANKGDETSTRETWSCDEN